jgi:hypothetical protein
MPDVGKWMHLPLAERIYEPSWWLSGAVGYYRLPSGDAEHIAKIDGFENLAAMRAWFRDRYGLPFGGYRIMWHGLIPVTTEGGGDET